MRDDRESADSAEDVAAYTVGDRVVVCRDDGDTAPGGRGTLIEDYAPLRDRSDLRQDRSGVRRWAVALDTGQLTFVDDADIEVEVDTGPIPIGGGSEPTGDAAGRKPPPLPMFRSPWRRRR